MRSEQVLTLQVCTLILGDLAKYDVSYRHKHSPPPGPFLGGVQLSLSTAQMFVTQKCHIF